ncbi:MerR family transcriptional regulator [Jeotgalibacillus proteolyticus]|uniref:Transcriptional regulator n=1 Tax=Jeotgalibacillus proteolyticus TaxID=2082395 RepID=A0A2S5GDN7_9BACL|nr:MerR family transcriptional regulator [Jeotgalibacillus proteolyticus]PPA71003.1 transcriptional regulator [Jeotgalibacillus proteolyticus]
MIKPIVIARKLKISTSALRHYEAWGIVPKAERSENGYRLYTKEHVAYFECIRALNRGFGMKAAREIMPFIMEGNPTEALWVVNRVQGDLRKEKERAELALKILQQEEDLDRASRFKKQWYSIGEAAESLDLAASTLRHWEKEGLICPERMPDSGYRKYSREDLQRLLIIRTLKTAVYSLDIVREAMDEMGQHTIKSAVKVIRDSLALMDNQIKEQLHGLYYLYKLIGVTEEKKDS